MAEAIKQAERLARQSLDLAPRGKGSKARRRVIELESVPTRARTTAGRPRGGRVRSKREQRFLFAIEAPFAHAAAKRGAAYRALPERSRKRP